MVIDIDKDSIWDEINKINTGINSKVEFEFDDVHYNKLDYWTYPEDYKGDCEDYAIAKKVELEKINIPSHFATCWIESGQYHVVLIIHSNYGDIVLDSLHLSILNFSDLPYKWHKIEGEDGKWFTILDS